MWRSVVSVNPTRFGHEVHAPVTEVVEAVVAGGRIHVRGPGGLIGPSVRVAPAGEGSETIIDFPDGRRRGGLADLPTF